MHDEVWAGLFHSASTDEHPQHQYCPKGPDTWCKFYQDLENGIQHSHKKEIEGAVVHEVIPIYRRLSSKEMLKGCLGGYTQNNCETINHLIWLRCPKSMFSGRDRLDSAIKGSVVVFNEGLSAMGNVLLLLE